MTVWLIRLALAAIVILPTLVAWSALAALGKQTKTLAGVNELLEVTGRSLEARAAELRDCQQQRDDWQQKARMLLEALQSVRGRLEGSERTVESLTAELTTLCDRMRAFRGVYQSEDGAEIVIVTGNRAASSVLVDLPTDGRRH